MKFSALITKEENWYIARCPELNVTTQGETFEEAKSNLAEAVEVYLESFGEEDLSSFETDPIWTTIEVSPHV